MEKLFPDQLKGLWQAVVQHELTAEEFDCRQERLLAEYTRTWTQALLIEGYEDLQDSLLTEIGQYVGCTDMAELRHRCQQAVPHVRQEWERQVDPHDARSIEQFYDVSDAMLYELMWWHTLREDTSPLAYVTALHFARQHGCRDYLDFGSGVGSGAILFGRHGFPVSLADISTRLLRFCQWRLGGRRLAAEYVDLNVSRLPS